MLLAASVAVALKIVVLSASTGAVSPVVPKVAAVPVCHGDPVQSAVV